MSVARPGSAQIDNAGADNVVPLAPALDAAEPTPDDAALPPVRLTPPVVSVDGDQDAFRVDLSGLWSFSPSVPVPFTGKAEQLETWHDVEMPGHFALQGHDKLGRDPGDAVAFFKSFDIPADWDGRSVFLRFGSIDGHARLWCNGTPVGSSDSAFLPVEFELTPFLKPGETNNLALTIEVSPLTGWYLRPMGGMGRRAELLALPPVHLSRMHADAQAPDGETANLDLALTVRNDAPRPSGDVQLTAELFDAESNPVELDTPWTAELPPIPAGQRRDVSLTRVLPGLKLWNPEQPHLYTLRVTLASEAGRMTTQRTIGFRTIAIDGHRVLVNGKPIQLFGVNYHVTHPGFGHFPPLGLIEKDLRILRDANVNALRAWPTPYRDLIDACNTLGLWTTIEVPVNLQLYAPGPLKDHGNNPALDQPYLALAARVVETYRSDPSVLFWGLANESIYYPYFQRAARAIHAADPTRPVFFGGDGRMGVDIPGVQINDEHYPRDGVASLDDLGTITADPEKPDNFGWHFPDDRPAISSEWMHTHVNNRAQIALDPGVDDYWGYVAEAHAVWTRDTPNFVGGFQFLSAPYHEIGGQNKWRGLFDDQRRPAPNLWHLKKAYSPVAVQPGSVAFDAEVGKITATLLNRHDFSDLNELTWTWMQGDLTGNATLSAAPGESTAITLPWNPALPPVELRADSPRGFEVDRFVLTPPSTNDANESGTTTRDTPNESGGAVTVATDAAGHHVVRAGDVTWVLSADTGLLLSGRLDDRPVLDHGPKLTVRGNGFPGEGGAIPPMGDLLSAWTAESVEMVRHAAGVTVVATVTGAYDHAEGTWTYTFFPDGRCDIAYDILWTWDTPRPIDAFEVGVAFAVGGAFDTLHWQRDAQWSAYPDDHIGRPIGAARALGDPEHRAARENARPADPPTWPWSQVLRGGVTRDFRSSKLNFVTGGLFDAHGIGLLALANGRQHLRATPRDGDDLTAGYTLQVNDFFNGGTEYHLIKSLRIERLLLSDGTKLTGTVTIQPTQRDD